MSKPPNPKPSWRQTDSGQDVQSSVWGWPQTSLFAATQESGSMEMIQSLECEKLEPDVDNKKRHLRGPISGRRQAVGVRGF